MKNNRLIQNIEMFHRLALFPKRTDFLKSLAQSALLSNDIKERIDSVVNDLAYTKSEDPRAKALVNTLLNFKTDSNPDLNRLYQAVVDASNTIPGSNLTQVERALELAKMIRELNAPKEQPKEYSDETLNLKPDAVHDRIKVYPPISKDVQQKLSDLLVMMGLGMPLKKIDGKIGPETRAALKTFREKVDATLSPTASLQEIESKINTQYAQRATNKTNTQIA